MHYRTDQIKVFTAEKELRNIQSITVGMEIIWKHKNIFRNLANLLKLALFAPTLNLPIFPVFFVSSMQCYGN